MIKVVKLLFLMSISFPVLSDEFKLFSTDISNGEMMSKTQEFIGFGCNGGNLSPHLRWSGVPQGTKSFAITVYDPDAPTGSGWWHWQIVNIPSSVSEILRGAGDVSKKTAPSKSMQIKNDFGSQGFGGACPPAGDKPHRYQFTIHALSVKSLDVKVNASGALVGYMIRSNSLASSTIEALYKR